MGISTQRNPLYLGSKIRLRCTRTTFSAPQSKLFTRDMLIKQQYSGCSRDTLIKSQCSGSSRRYSNESGDANRSCGVLIFFFSIFLSPLQPFAGTVVPETQRIIPDSEQGGIRAGEKRWTGSKQWHSTWKCFAVSRADTAGPAQIDTTAVRIVDIPTTL